MSLSGINFSGLGTGIDTESIIEQLSKIEQRPILKLQQRQQQIQRQQTALAQITALVTGLQAASSTLNGSSGFSLVKASVGDETVARITVDAGAQVGAHSLTVSQLAQSQKLGGAVKDSQTTPLNVSGQFVVNGKAVTVAATDTLQSIAASINGAKAGVNASIISPSANTYMLVLTSTSSGKANTISLSDVGGGTILQSALGLVSGTTSIRAPITNGAAGSLFSDSSTSIASLVGLSSPPSGTIQIDGVGVSIDLSTDSLSSIAGKINAAAVPGVTASVVSTTDPVSGASRQQLKIVGGSVPAFTDSNNILTTLGILQNDASSELMDARDAQFKLDGIDITRSSNTIKDVISGVTINLLKDTGAPTTTFDVTSDIEGIKQSITTFVNQYNQLSRTIGELSAFDPVTMSSGPLFGDVTVQNVLNSVTDILTGAVKGLSGTTTLFAQIGITLDKTNVFNINDTELTAALTANLSDVARIFQAAGVATDSAVSFVSATDKTKASSASGYAVEITKAAAQATVTGPVQHTANDNADAEVLTFAGGQFPSSGMTIVINPNSSLDDIVAQINADKNISPIVTAANAGGYLQLTAKLHGSAYSFTVHSSQAAAANNSGIGIDTMIATGVDVEGTINGEAATGKGQFLTGNAGNSTTDGLQIRVSSGTIGSKGTVTYTSGLAAQTLFFAQRTADALTGTLTQYSSALGGQVEDISTSIEELQAHVKEKEQQLRLRFAAMEAAVARIKAAGAGLGQLAASMTQR